MPCPAQFAPQPLRYYGRIPGGAFGAVDAWGRTCARGHDVAAVGPHINLPRERRVSPRTGRAAVASSGIGIPVPDMQAAGRSPYPQRALVVRGILLPPIRGKQGQGVEAGSQTGEFDLFGDGDTRQQMRPVNDRHLMGVDVDHDETGRPAGHSHTCGRGVRPPAVDARRVGRRRVKTMAGASCGEAWAGRGLVSDTCTGGTVPDRRLTAWGQRVHRPALRSTPTSDGLRGRRGRGRDSGCTVSVLTFARHRSRPCHFVSAGHFSHLLRGRPARDRRDSDAKGV